MHDNSGKKFRAYQLCIANKLNILKQSTDKEDGEILLSLICHCADEATLDSPTQNRLARFGFSIRNGNASPLVKLVVNAKSSELLAGELDKD